MVVRRTLLPIAPRRCGMSFRGAARPGHFRAAAAGKRDNSLPFPESVARRIEAARAKG
jgi:hypothetical protein